MPGLHIREFADKQKTSETALIQFLHKIQETNRKNKLAASATGSHTGSTGSAGSTGSNSSQTGHH